MTNQLRAHLQTAFTAAVGLFADLDSDISLRFLTRFPNQDKADWLTPVRMAARLRAARYSGRQTRRTGPRHAGRRPPQRHRRTRHRPRAYHPSTGHRHSRGPEPNRRPARAHRRTTGPAPRRRGLPVVPRSGTVRAARLLAEIGDARGRFPTPETLACLAGFALHPTIRQDQSCHVPMVRRQTTARCRHRLRRRHPTRQPWAARLYQQAIDRGHDHPHATRILARAWLHVIWKCWQTNTPLQTRRAPSPPKAGA